MYRIVLVVGSLWILSGCTSKEEKLFLEERAKVHLYDKHLQKTAHIVFKQEERVVLASSVTYLPYEERDVTSKEEVFIVGVLMANSSVLNPEKLMMRLEGQSPLTLRALQPGDVLLQDISFQSKWHRFYRVSFPFVSKKSLSFTLSYDGLGTQEMHFAKGAKYMLHHRAGLRK